MSFQSKVDEFVQQTRNLADYCGDWRWAGYNTSFAKDPNPPRFAVDPAYAGSSQSVGFFWSALNPYKAAYNTAVKGLGYRIIHQQDTRRRIKAILDNQPPFSVAALKTKV